MELESRLLKIALDVLAVLIPIAVAALVRWLANKAGVERLQYLQRELEAKQELATLAVRFAEQAFRDAGGPAKLAVATEWLSARAKERGINVTPDEIRGLIEAALRMLKDSFGEEWAKVVGEEQPNQASEVPRE